MKSGIKGIPKTYNRNAWSEEIEGLRWYVEWKEKTFTVNIAGRQKTLIGDVRLNYFTTQKAAHDFIAERQSAKDYEWYKEPGWEELVA